ncbi:galactosyltransferase-related protein [Neobacillus cucumis]|uniref:galactosyltransferase-related protein n=1 Tax=Neobacillus cucumis TaxID=1740721 RepID=UPI0019636A8A|nr:galactosyltransferase-related protein [Neobacillus cucumis]MBM7656473.1 glycosyltransferase involved in cell wall biosynthesis [Neobacillus cucumis]
MFENVSIIIPFQSDYGPRAKAFEWIKRYYASTMPEAELCIGIIYDKEINKSRAINLAAKNATRDILVIADADVVYDPNLILESIPLLEKGGFVVPFTDVYNVEQYGTEKLLKTKPAWPLNIKSEYAYRSNWVYEGFAGKLIVISRENFEAVGGFDERFIGWGGEDDAFSHAARTICGDLINIKGKVFHLWHPASSYQTNPHGRENGRLLHRYESASGNKEKMLELIQEKKLNAALVNNEKILPESPKSKICFAILVHEDRELVKELIENVRYYCPNSTFVLYNGGNDPALCEGLGVPVCPTSHKLKRGWTTIHFLEVMEWLEELGIEYEYFINIDSDALFIKKGYEEFIQSEMQDTDYMAVYLRVPEKDWYIGKELKKDVNRWKAIFNVDPFYGVFNVGQVISRPIVKALLDPVRKQTLKNALIETPSFGTDEIFFVNMAIELGFRIKKYPNKMDTQMIRYRPYFTIDEMMYCLTDSESSCLCHPILRDKDDPVRKLILHLEHEHNTKKYKSKYYPWYEEDAQNYEVSIPIYTQFGNKELVVRSGSTLTHYYRQAKGKWYKSETFATDVAGIPLFFENHSGHFAVVCKLNNGDIGFWLRDNKANDYPWYGPTIYQLEKIEPIMAGKLPDGKHIIVFTRDGKYIYWELDRDQWYKVFPNREDE